MAIPFKSNITVPSNWSLKTDNDINLLGYNGVLNIGSDGSNVSINSSILNLHTDMLSIGSASAHTALKFTSLISTELSNSTIKTIIRGSSIELTSNTTYVSQDSNNTTFSGLKMRRLYYNNDEKPTEKQINLSTSDTGNSSSLNGYQLVGLLVGIRTNVANPNLTSVDGYNIFIPLLANSYYYLMSSMGSGWNKTNMYYAPCFTVDVNIISPYVSISAAGQMTVYSGHPSYTAISQIVGIYSTVMFEHFYDEPD